MPTPFETLQARFADALADSRCESALLDSLVEPGAGSASTQRAASDAPTAPDVSGVSGVSGVSDVLHQRIGLYRGNVHANRHGALASAYPVLHKIVGDAYFDALARAYAHVPPSRSGDLNGFGDSLPAFVEDYERDPRFAYLGDVARLEWALHRAHYAADAPVFSAQAWIEFGSERLLDACMQVHPACAVIASPHAIVDIWTAHQPGGAFPARIDVTTHALIVRQRWQAAVIVQSAAAHAAFIALQCGRTLNDALDAAFALYTEFDFASQWRTWIETSAITRADIKD